MLTSRITGRRELTLICKSAGHRRSRACDGSPLSVERLVISEIGRIEQLQVEGVIEPECYYPVNCCADQDYGDQLAAT